MNNHLAGTKKSTDQSKIRLEYENKRTITEKEMRLGLNIENREYFTPVQIADPYLLPITKLAGQEIFFRSIDAIESLKTLFIGFNDKIFIDGKEIRENNEKLPS